MSDLGLRLDVWRELSQEAKDMAESVLLGSTDFNQSLNDAVNCDDSLYNHCLGQYFVGIQDVNGNPIIPDNDIPVEKEVVITCVEETPAEPVVPLEPNVEHQPGPSSEGKRLKIKAKRGKTTEKVSPGIKRKRGRPIKIVDTLKRVEMKRERERKASQKFRDKKKYQKQQTLKEEEALNNRNKELKNKLMAAEGLYSSFKQLYANIFDSVTEPQAQQSLETSKKQFE